MVDPDGRIVVLVVEDDESYREALSRGLTLEGFVVVDAADIRSAREKLRATTPDLVLLDVMLPDGSGVDFCQEIRRDAGTPVIMVSAKSEELDIVLGLEFGAADYVTKPYRLRELVARMRAVLRRHQAISNNPEIITVGDIIIDPSRREVTKAGATVDLSRKEFELLALFASRLGHVVTREECIDALWWGQDLLDTRTLDTHVKRLRAKIEDDPAAPRHLITIRGVGFRLDSPA
jgi:two-component system, OmpR family, response regulator RegX3